MAAADAFVGEGLADSPFYELVKALVAIDPQDDGSSYIFDTDAALAELELYRALRAEYANAI